VRVRAAVALQGQSWTCTGEYVADGSGEVHTAHDPSLGGSYLGRDPFGLFWGADVEDFYDWSSLAPMQVELHVTSGGDAATASYDRVWLGPGTMVRDVREDGVVGRLFLPADAADAPSIVILAGSNGGLGGVPAAALLSGHGVAALALAYWRYPGTPDRLRDIDVEVVGNACDWLRRQDGVADRRPTVLGISRGGELALLAGSLMPDRVGTVVSDVGSGVPWGALGPGTDVNETGWRFAGRPVPQMVEDADDPNAHLDDPDAVAAAEIAVERCSGRVLLLSSADDLIWPSARLSEIAARRAARLGAGDRVAHVRHPDAGHAGGAPPGYAAPVAITHPVSGERFAFGGTREGNHAARLDSWRRLLEALSAPA
jgi:hypothetical protein